MSWIEKLHRAKAELAERDVDPFRVRVESIVGCVGDCVSSAAILDLLGLKATTGNGRRIAPTMRKLGFIPIKSRRFEPGGWRGTVTRGWVRPFRQAKQRSSLEGRDTIAAVHTNALVHHRPI
jgi:hypothetical protein